MSDEQSFYEIQLNTPHLVLAFFGAVVVGVSIFWLGVVVGRGQGDTQLGEDWQAAVPGGDEQGSDDEPQFYQALQEPVAGDDDSRGEGVTGDADEATQTPPAEETEEGLAAPEFQPVDRGVSEPAAGEPAASEPPATEPAGRAAAPPTPSGLPAHDPGLSSGWLVQVSSTPDRAEADALQARLVGAGFPAFVISADVRGQTYHRVRIGRYRSESDAQRVADRLETRADVASTWVTEG